jgi:cell division protein FtsB
VTEREICIMYRGAKNQNAQIQILVDLSSMSRIEIIKILVRNGEKLPSRAINQLYKRLDALEAQISEREKEYREIVQALNGGKK